MNVACTGEDDAFVEQPGCSRCLTDLWTNQGLGMKVHQGDGMRHDTATIEVRELLQGVP